MAKRLLLTLLITSLLHLRPNILTACYYGCLDFMSRPLVSLIVYTISFPLSVYAGLGPVLPRAHTFHLSLCAWATRPWYGLTSIAVKSATGGVPDRRAAPARKDTSPSIVQTIDTSTPLPISSVSDNNVIGNSNVGSPRFAHVPQVPREQVQKERSRTERKKNRGKSKRLNSGTAGSTSTKPSETPKPAKAPTQPFPDDFAAGKPLARRFDKLRIAGCSSGYRPTTLELCQQRRRLTEVSLNNVQLAREKATYRDENDKLRGQVVSLRIENHLLKHAKDESERDKMAAQQEAMRVTGMLALAEQAYIGAVDRSAMAKVQKKRNRKARTRNVENCDMASPGVQTQDVGRQKGTQKTSPNGKSRSPSGGPRYAPYAIPKPRGPIHQDTPMHSVVPTYPLAPVYSFAQMDNLPSAPAIVTTDPGTSTVDNLDDLCGAFNIPCALAAESGSTPHHQNTLPEVTTMGPLPEDSPGSVETPSPPEFGLRVKIEPEDDAVVVLTPQAQHPPIGTTAIGRGGAGLEVKVRVESGDLYWDKPPSEPEVTQEQYYHIVPETPSPVYPVTIETWDGAVLRIDPEEEEVDLPLAAAGALPETGRIIHAEVIADTADGKVPWYWRTDEEAVEPQDELIQAMLALEIRPAPAFPSGEDLDMGTDVEMLDLSSSTLGGDDVDMKDVEDVKYEDAVDELAARFALL